MRFTLNGKPVEVEAPPMARLLDVLREDLALTGTKEGCGEGECGACTVVLDGDAVNACLVPMAHVAGAKVTTIEGMGGEHPLQVSFAEHGGAQCGICTPGLIMAASTLSKRVSPEEMRAGLAGNLCRCTGYGAVYRSVAAAGATKTGRARAARVPAAAARTKKAQKEVGRRVSSEGKKTRKPTERTGKTVAGKPNAKSRGQKPGASRRRGA